MGSSVQSAGIFLIEALTALYTWAVILRFLLQAVRADFFNPLSQAVVTVTNMPLKPLRRLIPGYKGYDIAAVVLAFAVQVFAVILISLVRGGIPGPGVLLWVSLIKLMDLWINLYFFTILVQVILSWVNPAGAHGHPVAAVLWQINRPLLAPIQRLIPAFGGLDLSPLFAMLGLQVIRILLQGMQNSVLGMM